MAKDTTAFRERFKAYKDGKSVKEIYDGGLPRYSEGTHDFSDEEAMEYILQLENPHRIGYSKGIWRTPKDSSKYDVHQIGGGLDIREEHNPIVYNYLKSKGRLNNPWLTEAEEKALRMQTWKGKKANMDKFVAKYGDKLSQLGYNTAAGMLWHGHPFKMMNTADSITGKALATAMASGDKDLDSVFDTYYRYGTNAKKFASRIDANTKYRKAYKPTVIAPRTELIEQLDNAPKFQPWSNYHGTDYPINSPTPASISSWNSPQSPAYTPVEYGASQSYLRLPDIKDVIEQSIMMPNFKDGKSPIHIKPANRGKLTNLKKRTGKSEAELYKTGGPAVRKMITFARNARKWKH